MSCWFVYLIRTNSGALYTGITRDVERRFAEHSSGGPRAAKALRGRGPLTLEFQQAVGSHSTALRLELLIKKWPKARKEALIEGRLTLPRDNQETATVKQAINQTLPQE
ncbi:MULTISPECIES: GIY-YIG nuclease family protein [Microbulbifer]|uniref:GIY-YIG nuclease family protein n=1 Tax=Microbulbifer celer TaxID=435905 RepID=A0ABW3U5M1_9GAMM|nr:MULTISPECIES: GIY-YIG nuclease family protein [Microbulbifer]UFN58327.1 GIY-YIG nuclease family protein [Microbulbifer celer]